MGAFSGLWDVLFPPTCIACRKVREAERPFCDACAQEVEPLSTDSGCALCHEPGGGQPLCLRCQARPPPFEEASSAFVHGGAVSRAIHLYKYEDTPQWARPLGQLLFQNATSFLKRALGEVCPIPLHERRFRQRRYDQAVLLAAELARLCGRPLADEVLVRKKETLRQVGQNEEARDANVDGAFEARGNVVGRNFILVDDVYTTGATARSHSSGVAETRPRTF